MSFTISSFINALGWTLIHSLWQGAMLFLLLKLVLLYMKDSPARIRYDLSCFALGGIFIFFLLTFYDQWERISAFSQVTFHASGAATTGTALPGAAFSPPSFKDHFTGNWLLYPVGLYAVGLFFFLVKVIRDLYLMRTIRNTGKRPFDRVWENYLIQLARAWKIPQNVGLYLSEKVDVPVVIGYFKPVIYLPFSLVNHLPPEQIETILLHELAHIKRADFLVNILQTLVETLLFFNPFAWAVSKMINKERELACDERVVAEKGPKTYAESLLALEENRMDTGKLVLAATHKKQQLFYRIKNIMEMKTKKFNVAQKLLVFAFIIITAFSISWLTPGNEKHIPPRDKTQKAPVTIASVRAIDTTQPPAPTPPNPTLAATPPAVPANLQNKPPVPPVPPQPVIYIDSIPRIIDSTLSGVATGIQQYFNSEGWKNYMQSLKAYTSTLKQYYKSEDWQKYQKQLKDYARQMKRHFNSKEWQKQQEAIRKQALAMKQQFKSDAWKRQIDSMRYAFAINRPDTDSILRQVKKRIARLAHEDNAIMTVTDGEKSVNTNKLIDKLNTDGLLRNKDNYKIRLDDRGLFINGKKQPDTYYKKYRSLVGDHTRIKIKKNNGTTSSSISTGR